MIDLLLKYLLRFCFFVVDSSVDFTQFKITYFCISLVKRSLDVNATTVVLNGRIQEIIRRISLLILVSLPKTCLQILNLQDSVSEVFYQHCVC